MYWLSDFRLFLILFAWNSYESHKGQLIYNYTLEIFVKGVIYKLDLSLKLEKRFWYFSSLIGLAKSLSEAIIF